jgi:chromosomal replication initiator protein
VTTQRDSMDRTAVETRSISPSRDRRLSQALAKRIGSHRYDMWFSQATLTLRDDRLEVCTDSQFAANWIDSHFKGDLRGAAQEALGHGCPVDIRVVNGEGHAGKRNGEGTGPARQEATANHYTRASGTEGPVVTQRGQASNSTGLRRLDDFVVGACNNLAFTAACRLASDAEARNISPLFIHGECGVGKTHLLQGICQRYVETTGRERHVRYVTAEQFTNEYIAAVRASTLEAFRQRIRKLDLLAIDDVHFFSNTARTQTEFQYTLDAIDLSGARLVLASDNHPHHIKRINQGLVSRFLAGLVVQVDPPDMVTRLALIERLSRARSLTVNQAAVQTIAENCLGSVRELEGAITKLAACSEMLKQQGRPNEIHIGAEGAVCALPQPNGIHTTSGRVGDEIGVILTQQIFKSQGWGPVGHSRALRLDWIIEVVCGRLNVTKADLVGSSRHRRIVIARAMVVHLARELTMHSYPEIAHALGRPNHSTVHTADQRLRKQLQADEHFDFAGQTLNLRHLADELRREVLKRSRQA